MLHERDIARIYETFEAPVVAFDCGQKCAHLNGGVPICCDDAHAIPVLYRSELVHVQKRSDLWKPLRPRDDHERKMARELPNDQRFALCKGHTKCERENRSFSCRSFPFFPYFDAAKDFVGLTYYWEYRGRCWILDRWDLVEPEFVRQCVAAWEIIFENHADERDFFCRYSVTARGVHTRLGRDMVVIGRDGRSWVRKPGSDALVPPPPGPTGPAP